MSAQHYRPPTPPTSKASILEFLSRHRVLGVLPQSAISDLAAEVIERTYPKGQCVCYAGDPVNYVLIVTSGLIAKMEEDAQGNACVVQIYRAGDLAGMGGALRGVPWVRPGTAAIDTKTLLLRPDTFVRLYRTFPELAYQVSCELSALFNRSQQTTATLRLTPVPSRLAAFLLDLAAEGTDPRVGGQVLNPALSHHELAFLLGTSRETVNRLMSRFSREDVIHADGRRLVILRPDALRVIAQRGWRPSQ